MVTHDGKDCIFVKAYGKEARRAYLRGMAVYKASVKSGLFHAPKPLELLEEQGIVVWEHIGQLVEGREFLIQNLLAQPASSDCRRLVFRRLGQALQAIQNELDVSGARIDYSPICEIRSPFPDLNQHVMQRLEEAVRCSLHWDFGFGNCFVLSSELSDPEIVIIDPAPNSYLAPVNWADVNSPIYVDAAQLVYSLWCHPRYFGWIDGEADSYLDSFISGYGEGGICLDKATILTCAAEIALIYQDYLDARGRSSAFSGKVDRWLRLKRVRFLHAAARKLIGSAGRLNVPVELSNVK